MAEDRQSRKKHGARTSAAHSRRNTSHGRKETQQARASATTQKRSVASQGSQNAPRQQQQQNIRNQQVNAGQPYQGTYSQPGNVGNYLQTQQGLFVQQNNGAPRSGQKTYALTKAQRDARRRRNRELRRRARNRRILFTILFLLLLIGGFVLIRHFSGSSELMPEDELDMADLEDDDDEEEDWDGDPIATILFAGDISTSEAQVAAVTRSDNTYDFSLPFADVMGYISDSDYAVADFETNLIDGLSYGLEPYYNSPIQLAGTLRAIGFRLMSTANTHILDNGIEGLNSTMDYLTAARLKHVGTYASQEDRDKNGGAYIRTIHGIKFAFLSYTKGTDAVSMPDGCEYALNTLYTDYADYWSDLRTSQITSDVQAAKDAGAEVIIALVHWGSEYNRGVSTLQEEAADALLSAGVDVIVGTHSHVVSEMGFQTVELNDGGTKESFVAYGIGDFYTDPEQDSAYTSVLLQITFSRTNSGISIEPHYIPIYQNITEETKGAKDFSILDTYATIARLARLESMDYAEACLYNALLDSIDTLHYYVDESFDAGPDAEDATVVQEAIADGAFSTDYLRLLKEEEDAEKEATEEEAAEEEAEENTQTEAVDTTEENTETTDTEN